jgi:hypothetical protein
MTLKRGQKLNKILIIQYLKGKLNFKAMEQIIIYKITIVPKHLKKEKVMKI